MKSKVLYIAVITAWVVIYSGCSNLMTEVDTLAEYEVLEGETPIEEEAPVVESEPAVVEEINNRTLSGGEQITLPSFNGSSESSFDATVIDADNDGIVDGLDFGGSSTADVILEETGVEGEYGIDIDGDGSNDLSLILDEEGNITLTDGSGNSVTVITDGNGVIEGVDTTGDDAADLPVALTIDETVELPSYNGSSNDTITGSFIDSDLDGSVDGLDLDNDGSIDINMIETGTEGQYAIDLDGDGSTEIFLNVDSEGNADLNIEADGTGNSPVIITDGSGIIEGIDMDGDKDVDVTTDGSLIITEGDTVVLPSHNGSSDGSVTFTADDSNDDGDADKLILNDNSRIDAIDIDEVSDGVYAVDLDNNNIDDFYIIEQEDGTLGANTAADGSGNDVIIITDGDGNFAGISTDGDNNADVASNGTALIYNPDPSLGDLDGSQWIYNADGHTFTVVLHADGTYDYLFNGSAAYWDEAQSGVNNADVWWGWNNDGFGVALSGTYSIDGTVLNGVTGDLAGASADDVADGKLDTDNNNYNLVRDGWTPPAPPVVYNPDASLGELDGSRWTFDHLGSKYTVVLNNDGSYDYLLDEQPAFWDVTEGWNTNGIGSDLSGAYSIEGTVITFHSGDLNGHSEDISDSVIVSSHNGFILIREGATFKAAGEGANVMEGTTWRSPWASEFYELYFITAEVYLYSRTDGWNGGGGLYEINGDEITLYTYEGWATINDTDISDGILALYGYNYTK